MPDRGVVRQWDACIADLDFPVGSEQGGGRRPVIVVSNDGFNQTFPVVTVVPLTKTEGKQRKVCPFEIVIEDRIIEHIGVDLEEDADADD